MRSALAVSEVRNMGDRSRDRRRGRIGLMLHLHRNLDVSWKGLDIYNLLVAKHYANQNQVRTVFAD